MKAILILFNGDILNDGIIASGIVTLLRENVANLEDKPQVIYKSETEVINAIVASGVIVGKADTQAVSLKLSDLIRYCMTFVNTVGNPKKYTSIDDFKKAATVNIIANTNGIADPKIMQLLCTKKKLDKEFTNVLFSHGLEVLPSLLLDINQLIKLVLYEIRC